MLRFRALAALPDYVKIPQHARGGSHLSVTPAPWDSTASSMTTRQASDTQEYKQRQYHINIRVWGMAGTLLLGAGNSELQSYAYYVQDPQVSPQHHVHACTHTSRLHPVIPVGEVDCPQTFLCC